MFRIIKIVFLRSFYAIKKTMSYTYEYPHPAVATDCVVFGFSGRSLEILLVERGIEPFKGAWAFPGGFLQIDETAEACARRELAEETGLQIQSLKQLGAFTGVHRDPRERVISIAFYALVRPSEVRGGDDASNARWFPIEDAPPLAFDHDYILRKAQQQLRKDIHFEPVGFDLLGPAFTMSELQRLYESILGVRFDRRNFEKKMLQTGILEQATEEYELPEETFDACMQACEPAPTYGSRQEMRKMDIDALFASPAPEPNQADASAPRKKPGRKGRKYAFLEDHYNRFKEGNNFRLEF